MNFILKINIVSVVIISAQYLSCSLHQTTNLVFPNFFSVLAVVREEKKIDPEHLFYKTSRDLSL